MISVKGEQIGHVSVLQALDEAARTRGNAFAIEIDGERLTFADWRAGAERLSRQLYKRGVRRGDVVATLMYNNAAQLFIWFGTIRLGAIWSPLNVALKGDDLDYTLRDCAPKYLFADTEALAKVRELASCSLSEDQIFCLSPEAGERVQAFEQLLTDDAPPAPETEIMPGDPAVIVYTGGTTGLPKGVVLPHFAYVAGGLRYREFWDPQPDDVHYSVMQFFHVGCQHGAVLAPLYGGVPSVIDRWFSASRYWARVRETNATLIDPLGTMLAILNKQPVSAADKQHRVRCCWFATAHLPRSVLDEFQERFGVKLQPGTYAQSETGGNYVVSQRLHDERHPPGACGKPWGWAELRIADEQDNALPAGEVGEILLRPVAPFTFMLRYHNKPEITQRALRNQWFHSGDMGWLDEDGYLFYKGRQAHWIRRRGENISAFEVESVIANHPLVQEVAIVGVPSELGEDEIKAFIILAPDADIDPWDIVTLCEQRLASFKAPRFVEFVSDFPRSAAKREVLREKLQTLGVNGAWDREAQKRPQP
jgi:crotonobetaine/carnitine-CoA ligase